MSITSVLVGSLQQGGGLDWQCEVFPRRLVSWEGFPPVDAFTVPGDKSFIAFATVHVFSGGHHDHRVYLETEETADGLVPATGVGGAPETGTHSTGLVGVQSGTSGRELLAALWPGYEAPDVSYQVSIWWAELPEVPEV